MLSAGDASVHLRGASNNLCHSLALVARRICTSYVDPEGLLAFVACKLNKNPGVRPIGIGDLCRRIISKATCILSVLGQDILNAVDPIQLCAGQDRLLYIAFVKLSPNQQPRPCCSSMQRTRLTLSTAMWHYTIYFIYVPSLVEF